MGPGPRSDPPLGGIEVRGPAESAETSPYPPGLGRVKDVPRCENYRICRKRSASSRQRSRKTPEIALENEKSVTTDLGGEGLRRNARSHTKAGSVPRKSPHDFMDLVNTNEFEDFTGEYAASLFESRPVEAASGLTV